MNITFQTNRIGSPVSASAPERLQAQPDSRVKGSFDTVTISRKQADVSDGSFARILAKKAAAETDRSPGSEKVFRLRQEIAAGTYRPDPNRIAEKLLGY